MTNLFIMNRNSNTLNEKKKRKVLFSLGGFSKNWNQEFGLEI